MGNLLLNCIFAFFNDSEMNKATLLLGGNLGDRIAFLENARNEIIKNVGRIISCSSIYESEAWGFECDQAFLNQVVVVETALIPSDLLKELKIIEKVHGRISKSGMIYTSRTLDIDILFYNDDLINEADLIIPHPRMHERKFTLLPLQEIEKYYIHPILNMTIEDILKACDDQLHVKRVDIAIYER
jgi:2-amino-4-hydroxy-6-hydroxymethyldihydropteridine diphosphokinase